MGCDFKGHETFSLSPVEAEPSSDSTAAPRRNPFSRAGSEQASSQIRPTNQRSDSQTSASSCVPLTPSTPSCSQEERSNLADFFAPQDEPRILYTDREIQQISRCLKFLDHDAWSNNPRLYIVLRTISGLRFLNAILDGGISDLWFPFTTVSVPKNLGPDLRAKFLDAQNLVLTKAVDLETGLKRHTHFGKEDAFPFEIRGKLGRGGYATVDKIFNPFSRCEYARKRFKRVRGQSKGEVESFKNELQVLKKIEHDHCISLVASYTDSKYFGLIMSPVADCNLAEYYDQVPENSRKLSLLRKFYGCLASALKYLHDTKIRHRDIKPENILVKDDYIYLTDFGISLDWDSLGRGTTTEDTGKSWIYCAPEVARYQKRNSSSDIWSLGCVFLEMTTLLKGRSIGEMRQYFKSAHDSYKFYECKEGIDGWSKELRASGSELDNHPLKWTAGMLRVEPDTRPSAEILLNDITSLSQDRNAEAVQFVGDCCVDCCFTDSDSESEVASDSDSDAWNESHMDGAVSALTPSLKPAQVTDTSIKSADREGDAHLDGPSVSPRPSHFSSPRTDETAIRGRMARLSLPAADTEEPSSSTAPLGKMTNVPYPSFSRAHSKEAVRALGVNTDLPRNYERPKPMEIARFEGLGLEFLDVMEPNATAETPLLPPRIVLDKEASAEDIEVDMVERGDTGVDLHTVAEMTAALLASRSRRTSSASADMPENKRPNNATSRTGVVDSQPTGAGARGRLCDLPGWQTIGLVNNLPNLEARSWIKPSNLLHDVKADSSFMTYLQANYKDCHDVVSASNIGDVTLLVEMLLKNGLKLDAWGHVDNEGISPLFRVLGWGEGYRALFKVMVNSGANLSYEAQDGRSLLSQAARCGQIWAIEILVDAGADLKNRTRRIPLVDAAEKNQLDTVEYLVNTLKVRPDLKGADSRTALRAASIEGHVKIMRFLLETCRSEVDIENKVNDQTILYDACVVGRTEVVELLLKYGADPNAASGVKTGKWTPLLRAVQACNVGIVKALVNQGAKISMKTLPMVSGAGPLGTTAIAEAKKCGNERILKFLLEEQKARKIVKRYKSVKTKNKGASSGVEEEREEE